MTSNSVIVIGGGIAGLTAASLLAKEGLSVTLLESHYQLGGCAGTFKRGKYIFDVGATQVAGFEEGGIHAQIFKYLELPLPEAKLLDIACLVDLQDGLEPITIWNDPIKWNQERKHQFPGSNKFWELCLTLHRINWAFMKRSPIIPVKNSWDLIQSFKALRLNMLPSGLFSRLTISDLLWICDCQKDNRLKKFLDLQLKLYSQQPADKTSALYGATVLQMGQYPLGLYHIKDSMQQLSNQLMKSLIINNGTILYRHKVTRLQKKSNWMVNAVKSDGEDVQFKADNIIFSLPPQNLLNIITSDNIPESYKVRIEKLSKPSGAIVFYGAIKRTFLSKDLPLHVQIETIDLGSLFISISEDGDGRAPAGEATIIASAFTSTKEWFDLNQKEYKIQKQIAFNKILTALNKWFKLKEEVWIHKELATPKSFEFWTGREKGIVGGLGQDPSNFGLFGLSSRTPMKGLWLCGDSIYPGEGTAGVSQSALIACRQLLASKGSDIKISI